MKQTDPLWRRLLRNDLLLLICAVAAGIAGAVFAMRHLGARADAAEAQVAQRYQARQVVVAATDLNPGDLLDAVALAVRAMPQDYLPPDAVPAEQASQLLGARARIALRRGTPVVRAAVETQAGTAHLASLLSGSERAVTIPVDDMNSQAGALRAGDHVDVYFSRSLANDSVLVPLLERVEVLAAGRAMLGNAAEDPHFSTVTLRVMLPDAQRLLLAQQDGQVALLLRSPADAGAAGGGIRHARELIRSPVAAPRASPTQVELLIGGAGMETPERLLLPVAARSARTGEST